MSIKLEEIQLLFTKRTARSRGPISSEEYNDNIEELAYDLLSFNSQWNQRLVPLVSTLPDGVVDPTVDAFSSGLSGKTLYTSSNATSTSESLYFNTVSSRPKTVFEQFTNVYSAIDIFKEQISNSIKNTVVSARDVPIDDAGGFYSSTNVETALQEVMADVNQINFDFDFNALTTSLIPDLDDSYDIGTSLLRWRDLFLGPASLNIISTAAESGGTARSYTLGINATGQLVFSEGATEVLVVRPDGMTEVNELLVEELGAAPSATVGYGTVYTLSSDKKLYFKDSSGTTSELSGAVTEANVLDIGADSDNNEANSWINLNVDGTTHWRIHNDSTLRSMQTTSKIRNTDGNAAGPSYTFDSDPDLGIFRSTAPERLGFAIAATESMSLSAVGLGLGTSVPTHTITLPITSTGLAVYNSVDQITNYERAVLDFAGSSRITLTTQAGGTGVQRDISLVPKDSVWISPSSSGMTTPASAASGLVVESLGDAGITIATPNANTGRIDFSDAAAVSRGSLQYNHTADDMSLLSSNDLIFSTATVERMRIDSSGNVGIGIAPLAGTKLRLPQENDAATPTLSFGDGNTGFYEQSDNVMKLSIGGFAQYEWQGDTFQGTNAAGPKFRNIGASGTVPNIYTNTADFDTGIGWDGADRLALIAGGVTAGVFTGAGIEFTGNTVVAGTAPGDLIKATFTANGSGAIIARTENAGNATISRFIGVVDGGTAAKIIDIGVYSNSYNPVFAYIGELDLSGAVVFSDLSSNTTKWIFGPAGAAKVVFGNNNAHRLTIGTNGNVMVGTNVLDAKNILDVGGAVAVGASYVGVSPAAPANGMIIQGSVGIGTQGPITTLDVVGDIGWGTTQINRKAGSIGANANYGMYVRPQAGTIGDFAVTDDTGASIRLLIDPAGNVGIGTSAPVQRLEVAPDTDVAAIIGKAQIGNVTGFNDFAAFTHVDVATVSGYSVLSDPSGTTYLNSATGTGLYFRHGNADQMTLLDGDLGIGIAAPVNKLDVVGAVAIGAAYAGVATAPANGMIVQDNVGIGQSSATYRLDVLNNGGQLGARFKTTGTNAGPTVLIESDDNSSTRAILQCIGDKDTTAIEALFVGSNGNVGIGTASPAFNLQLVNTSSVTINAFSSTSGLGTAIELGSGGTGNRTALIDFTGDDTFTDYGLRILRNSSGANTTSHIIHRGTGELQIGTQEAGSVSLRTTNVERMKIDAVGEVTAPAMDRWISISLTTANNNQTGLFNPFNTTSFGGVAPLASFRGMSFTSADGKINVLQDGYYRISVTAYVQQNALGVLTTFRLRKNVATTPVIIWDGSVGTFIHVANNASEMSITIIDDFLVGDAIELEVDSTGANAAFCEVGTSITVQKIASL